MSALEQQLQLFLNRAGIIDANQSLLQRLVGYFQQAPQDTHLIYKRSIIYVFSQQAIVQSIPCPAAVGDEYVYTFDGQQVSRLAPEYYTGSQAADPASRYGSTTSSNNNNNNNNNGNNNG